MTDTPPSRVLRFYGNVEYALECIGYKQIAYLHRDKLNDPFDPYLEFEIDRGDEVHPSLPPNYLAKYEQEASKEINSLGEKTFVFSTVGVSDGVLEDEHPKYDLYMWGHYANGHRGLAIEFDTELLYKAALKQGYAEGSIENEWLKIIYTDDPRKMPLKLILARLVQRNIINHVNKDNDERLSILSERFRANLSERLRTKGLVWEKENEWRLILHDSETNMKTRLLDLPDKTITAVYLGCRMDERSKHDIIAETRRNFPEAEIFACNPEKGKFKLKFEPPT